jgi:hypothetical protein
VPLCPAEERTSVFLKSRVQGWWSGASGRAPA